MYSVGARERRKKFLSLAEHVLAPAVCCCYCATRVSACCSTGLSFAVSGYAHALDKVYVCTCVFCGLSCAGKRVIVSIDVEDLQGFRSAADKIRLDWCGKGVGSYRMWGGF